MDPNEFSLGSGSQLLGGGVSPQLQRELQAMQTGQAGATSQVSPAAASFDPSTAAPAPPQASSPQPSPQAQSQSGPTPGEVSQILGALIGRLKLHNKVAESQLPKVGM